MICVAAKRYTIALAKVSESMGKDEIFLRELKLADDLLKGDDIRVFLANPIIKQYIKEDTISKIFEGQISDEMFNLIKLLASNNRINLLPQLYSCFKEITDKRKNILTITISSALRLDDEQVERIKEKYRKTYNAKEIIARVQIDESLIGGVVVTVGDKMTDSTIKERLRELKQLIVKR